MYGVFPLFPAMKGLFMSSVSETVSTSQGELEKLVGDLRGVARHLFGKLRELDAAGYRRIHVELAHGGGLADAINDRLRRAAAKG